MGWVMMSERELGRIEVLSRIAEGSVSATTAASVLAVSTRHIRRMVKRAPLLQGGIVGTSVHRAVGRRCRFAHAAQLTPWSHTGNPTRFVHLWMPPLVQVFFERLERVIGCGHVSGLSLRRLTQPWAGMAMRDQKQINRPSSLAPAQILRSLTRILSILCPYSSVTSSHSRSTGTNWPGRNGKRSSLMPLPPPGPGILHFSSSWPKGHGPFCWQVQSPQPCEAFQPACTSASHCSGCQTVRRPEERPSRPRPRACGCHAGPWLAFALPLTAKRRRSCHRYSESLHLPGEIVRCCCLRDA